MFSKPLVFWGDSSSDNTRGVLHELTPQHPFEPHYVCRENSFFGCCFFFLKGKLDYNLSINANKDNLRTSSTCQRLNLLPWFVSVVYIRVHNKWLLGMRMYTVVRGRAASKFVVRGGDRKKSFDSESSRHMYNNKICPSDFVLFLQQNGWKANHRVALRLIYQAMINFGVKPCGLETGNTVTCLHLKCTIRETNKSKTSAWPLTSALSLHSRQKPPNIIAATLLCNLSFKCYNL